MLAKRKWGDVSPCRAGSFVFSLLACCILFTGGLAQGKALSLEDFISDDRQLALFRQGLTNAEAFRQELCADRPSGKPRVFALAEFLTSLHSQMDAVSPHPEIVALLPTNPDWLTTQICQGTNESEESNVLGLWTGPWRSGSAQTNLDNLPAQQAVFFKPPVAVSGLPGLRIHSAQYLETETGFGWNAVMSRQDLPDRHFVLGAVFDTGNLGLNQTPVPHPHIGIHLGPNRLLWVTRNEMVFETVRHPGTPAEQSVRIHCP